MRSTKRPPLTALVLLVGLAVVASACNGSNENTLNGSGASFPKPFYEQAIADFSEKDPGITVNYGGGGSGKGKRDLADELVQWAGSDSAVNDADKAGFKGGEFLYFPTVAAPLTVSYNLEGQSELKLSADTVAKVFQGDITAWDDPAIAADNAGRAMPPTKITVVHRSDGSGTTSNFTKYLDSAAEGVWRLGASDAINWPTASQAGNGNNGVAQIVKDTNGAIGYVDYSDATATGLAVASIRNAAGHFVAPTLGGATAALDAAAINDDLTYSALNTMGENAYPITAGTYILVYVNQNDAKATEVLKDWLTFVLTDAQAMVNDVDFAPLPKVLQERALAQIDKIVVSRSSDPGHEG